MENKLEQLLNSLIKRGRVPFGYELLYPDTIEDCFDYDSRRKKCRFLIYKNFVDEVHNSLREVVSKESNLWQFVCENGMVKHEIYEDIQSWEHTTAEHSDFWYTSGDNYEYRLIESALCNEDRLEDFLLSNIKVDEKE